MRIAIVADAGHGQPVEFATALATLGHDARLIPPAESRRTGVLPYLAQLGQRLAEMWRGGWEPELVHAHFWTGGLIAMTATRELRVPVVQSYHELARPGDDEPAPQRQGFERVLGRSVNRIVAGYAGEADELARLGIPRASISVVPEGVALERFTPQGEAAPRGDAPRLLSVGPLSRRAGHTDAIRALSAVPGAELVIAGGPEPGQLPSDPFAAQLLALAEKAGVADRVRLLGAVEPDELPSWYRSADLAVCASRVPSFGRSALEAMACGVPVVGYELGGLSETVIHGVTGSLVKPGDVRALASALRNLLADPAARLNLSSGGLDRARSRYGWDRAATELSRVYQTIT